MRIITAFFVTICIMICNLDLSQSMKVIPQKANVTYINHKYIKWGTLTVRRYGRRSDYYMNLEGVKYHTWGNNITLHMIFNQFLHNEYRRSFVEMHNRMCDLINKDVFVGGMIRAFNITCPVDQNEFHMLNMTVPTQTFPYQLPFEKSRVDITFSITDTAEKVAEAHVFVLFKQ